MEMNRRSLPRTLGVVAVVVALAIASYGCGAKLDKGKVLFGTDYPTADGTCAPKNAVTSASAATAVYATYVFKARPGDEKITIAVSKDGTELLAPTPLTAVVKGLDCLADTTDWSTELPGWGTGAIHFKLASPTETVAEGDLTIK